jgi:hypothetical protein
VREEFEFKEPRNVSVKGKKEEVTVHRLLGRKAPAT